MIAFEEMDRRLGQLGKDRAWLATRTPYRSNSIRQALAPKGGARSQRLQEVLSRAIEDEELRQLAERRAQQNPGLHEIFRSSAELDYADRASRCSKSPSLAAFCREIILRHAEQILRQQGQPHPVHQEIGRPGGLAASPLPH